MPSTLPQFPSPMTNRPLDPQVVETWRWRIRMETEANYHCEMGTGIAREGNLPAAAEAFRRALRIKPDYPEASWQLVEVLRRLGEVGQAQAVHEDALSHRADYASFALCRLGQQAILRGKMDEAADFFDQAAQHKPETPAVILWRDLVRAARVHAPLSPLPDGLVAAIPADEAADLATEYSRVARDLMNCQLMPLAESLARRAAALDPSAYEASNFVAILLSITGNYAESARWSRRALVTNPGHAPLLMQEGLSQCYLGNFKDGEVSLRRAISVDSSDMSLHANLGYALRRQGKYPEAVAVLRHAVELPPPTPWVHGEVGRAYRGMGDLKRSAEAYRKGIALADGAAGSEWLQDELDDVLRQLG
ncbi:tetratricopeptide repeat protein [Azospirillum sp. sgz302134]